MKLFKNNTVFTGVWWKTVTIRQNIFNKILKSQYLSKFPPVKILRYTVIKELLGTEIVECNEICQAVNWWWTWKQQCSFLGRIKFYYNINPNHTRYAHLVDIKRTVDIINTDDTIKIFKNKYRNNRWWHGNKLRIIGIKIMGNSGRNNWQNRKHNRLRLNGSYR